MELSLDELAAKYAAGTLTDAELQASGYMIHQVKGMVRTPTCEKIWAALEKGLPDIDYMRYMGMSMGIQIEIKISEKIDFWGEQIVINKSRKYWSSDLCDLIKDKLLKETGISVFFYRRDDFERDEMTINWDEE